MMSICMELSPSMPSQRFSCFVPSVKMPARSSAPRAAKYTTSPARLSM